jgi:uncharacterized protein with beta-barrel porin domain
VGTARRGISQLALAPALALLPVAPGIISQAYAQCGGLSEAPCPTVTTTAGATPAQLESITAVSTTTTRSQVTQTQATIDNRLRDISRDLARGLNSGTPTGAAAPSGLSAGSDPARYATWLDSSGSYISNSDPAKGNQGRAWDVLAGIDATIDDRWIVGFTAGYNAAALSVNSFGSGGNRHTTGVVAGPYVSYVFNQNWSVDGNVNYTRLENTVVMPGVAAYSGNRYAVGINGNYFTDFGPVSFTGFGGYTYASERDEAFVDGLNTSFPESFIYYGAFKTGFEASWPIGNFEPYVPLTYEYQTTATRDGTGRNALIVGLGLRYTLGDALKLGIVATTTQLKSHYQEDTLAANLRYSF